MEELNNDDIHMCRTCGIFYSNNFLRMIFNNPFDEVTIMSRIRKLMKAWNIQVDQNDGRSEYVCTLCINEFERMFNFLDRCFEVHEEFTTLFSSGKDFIQVKKEIPESETKPTNMNFIYIDDLSDDGDDSQYEGSFVPKFDMSHMAFKDEKIEEARVPQSAINSEYHHPIGTDVFLPFAINDDDDKDLLKNSITATTTAIPFADMANNSDKIKSELQEHTFSIDNNIDDSINNDEDDEVKVVKFTYDDDIKEDTLDSIDIQNNQNLTVGMSGQDNGMTTTTNSTCKLCLHVAPDKTALREHFKRIHEVKDFDCHICGKKFKNSTSSRLRYHLKWHKLNKHVQCVVCGFNCASRDILNEHKRAVHGKIECIICKKKIYAKRMKGHLRTHELTAAASTSYQCFTCNELFDREENYNSHMIIAHGSNNADNFQDETLDSIENVTNICDLEQHLDSKLSLEEEGGEELSVWKHQSYNTNSEDEIDNVINLNEDSENDFIINNEVSQQQTQQQSPYAQQLLQQSLLNLTSPHKVVNEEIEQGDISMNHVIHVTQILNNGAIFALPKTPLKEQSNELANQILKCAQCPERFTSVDDLINHSKLHKRNFFKCALCEKSFDLKFKLNRHMQLKHPNNQLDVDNMMSSEND